MFKRVFLIILDSVGIGEAKDAAAFDDAGTNTFKHATEGHEVLEHLKDAGFYNLAYGENNSVNGYYTKGLPKSNGKDSLTGHLEIGGVITKKPFKTFLQNGFPQELIAEIEKLSGRKVIGNRAADGIQIIKELGERQMETGALIVYTSADSVLQIAANEEVIPLEELYSICEKIRAITLKDEWKVGRIIARPFIGNSRDTFERTANRHDYAVDPDGPTVLDGLSENNYDTISIGKISDLFNNRGVKEKNKTTDNLDGINKILEYEKKDFNGLCFANLNDYDSKYGHRRNKEGYYNCLKEFDNYLPKIMSYLRYDDLLIITADHGNDPTYKGTDHTRENIPVIIYSKKFINSGKLPDLDTYADIGATILDNFGIYPKTGNSILDKLK